jgi:hypothetical protein
LPKIQCIRRLGSAALDLCYLACGRIDGYWEPMLHPWDTAAGSLIVTEAGGRVTKYNGNPFDPNFPEILASNGHIHNEMLKIYKCSGLAIAFMETNNSFLSVTELNKLIKKEVETSPYLNNIYVKGEIYNLTYHSSGHIYFFLKDDDSTISATFFRYANKGLKFKLEEGMSVIAFGNITVFEKTRHLSV